MRQELIGMALCAPLALATGCGTSSIDQGKLEDEIATKLNVQVTCPKDQEAKKGNEFQCTGASINTPSPGATPGSTPSTEIVRVDVEVLNEDGDVRFEKAE